MMKTDTIYVERVHVTYEKGEEDEAWAQVKPEDGWNITYAGMPWKIGHKGVGKLTAERVVKHSVKYNVSPTDIQIVADQLADKD